MIDITKPFWYRQWWSWNGIKLNCKTIFTYIKWAKQRLTRGYCDGDTWNFDTYLANVIVGGLRHLATEGMSYAGNIEFPTFEIWSEYLKDTADMIEYGAKDPDELNENPFPIGTSEYTEQYKRLTNQQQDCLDQGFERLAHIFKTLWD